MKKYEFTGETEELIGGTVLRRIRAVRDFGHVKRGELGGWIEKDENLSHEGSAWVGEEAVVWGNARVEEHAQVRDHAQVYGDAQIRGMGRVWDRAVVCENAKVDGRAVICDFARMFERSRISDDVEVSGTMQLVDDECYGGEQIITNKYPLTRDQERMLRYVLLHPDDGRTISWLPINKYLSIQHNAGEKTLLSINERGDIFDAATTEMIAKGSMRDGQEKWEGLRRLFPGSYQEQLDRISERREALLKEQERKEQQGGRNHRTKGRR
ncbi:MAG: hypothetical protein Q4C48_03380 [Lachnospiraceae bacterium]|nr:hypothetical protein [Lachnospiraceae bacterium]